MSSNGSASTEHRDHQAASSDSTAATQGLDELLSRNAELEEALEVSTRENILTR